MTNKTFKGLLIFKKMDAFEKTKNKTLKSILSMHVIFNDVLQTDYFSFVFVYYF